MISLILFFLLISSGSFYVAAKHGRRYEETVPLTIFCSVEIVFLFGLVDNLKLGVWVCCLGAAILYVLGIRQVVRVKNLRETLSRILTPALVVFLLAVIVYALCVMGRVACRNDEFSFWATSVKKMWYLNAFHCIPAAEPYFAEYPPGMQILQYTLQSLNGSFSEWHISAAYMTYVFALFLPFLKGLRHRHFLQNLLVLATVFTCGTIIYPYALDNLMVDFALGATFAYGMAMIFTLPKRDGRYDSFAIANVILSANMLILIKSAGKLFAAIVLLSLVITLLPPVRSWRSALCKTKRRTTALYIGGLLVPCITAFLWKLKYSYYQVPVIFDEGKYDLKEFFGILLGGGEGFRTEIRGSFLSFLISERVQIGFLSLTNLQLALLLLALLFLLTHFYRKADLPGSHIAVSAAVVALPVYWLGLMASYMYTFSEGEGTALASMQRYLNIYFTGLLLLAVFLILYGSHVLAWSPSASCTAMCILLCFVSYGDILSLVSRQNVAASVAQRAPFQAVADQIFADPNPKAEEGKNGVLLVHRDGYPHNPVNQFTYMMWPEYQVPWECSYGTTPLFDGDGYTQLLTPEQFRQHVNDLGVDYLALELLDEDFIATYAALFDSPLENGQVYKVVDETGVFQKMNG